MSGDGVRGEEESEDGVRRRRRSRVGGTRM